MALRSAVILVVGAMLLPRIASAQSTVRVAVYAPWSGPSTADDRHALTLAIESALSSGAGSIKVASYAKLRDFRREIDKGACRRIARAL